jgi:hypothetical protein
MHNDVDLPRANINSNVKEEFAIHLNVITRHDLVGVRCGWQHKNNGRTILSLLASASPGNVRVTVTSAVLRKSWGL